MVTGSRVSHHLREFNHLHLGFGFRLGFGFCYTKTIKLSLKSPFVAVSGKSVNNFFSSNIDFGHPFVGCIGPKSQPSQSPFLSDCLRAPIVAKCDRKQVLSSWAPYCGQVTPIEFQVKFSKVRNLTPRQFVEKLSKELGVSGVVAGKNYRFGYKAAGDASELVRLCKEYGMGAYIINSVMDKKQDSIAISSNNPKEQGQVSSTRVRHALGNGDMKYVSELLGRPHRLILVVNEQERFTSNKNRVSGSQIMFVKSPT